MKPLKYVVKDDYMYWRTDWNEKLICPKCDSDNRYVLYYTMEYPYGYVCVICGFDIIINSRKEEIEKLSIKRRYYINEIKLTMWD